MSEPKERLVFYQLSHEGEGPSPNQACAVSIVSSRYGDSQHANFGLFVVAHGATNGGEAGFEHGAKAACLVSRKVTSEVLQNFYYSALSTVTMTPLQHTLETAILAADSTLRKTYGDSASSLTAAVIVNNRLYLGHIGHTRAYLVTQNSLELLTTDYAVPFTVNHGGTVRAIGYGDMELTVDIVQRQLPLDARLLLLNQGLWGDDEVITAIEEAITPEAVCHALVESVKERQAGNVATIMIQLPSMVGN